MVPRLVLPESIEVSERDENLVRMDQLQKEKPLSLRRASQQNRHAFSFYRFDSEQEPQPRNVVQDLRSV
ncbi:MAG: hypothetical protein DMG64_15260 [Acidobacteria bacterium]|nr:MAG: hypothetical protein DMG63_04990 [Acidobacteriota bacterium]PYY01128.1 MAG: hypothetical protein DMG64_15260 [Acidobacteriota bacterium]